MWSDAMGQGEKAYPFVCPECGEEVRGNERHFSIQPLLNRIMLTIEGNRTSIGEELERFITVYASFGAEFLSSPLQTVQCETAKPERAQLTSLKISMESLLNQMEVQMQLEKGILRKIVHYQQVEGGNLAGVDVGDKMIGENLLDVVEKKNHNRANEVYAQISESRCGRCIRTADYMYSVYAPGVNGGEAAASDVYADDFLYDMQKDPWQLNNVVADPAYADVKAELRERLLNWIQHAEGTRPTITD